MGEYTIKLQTFEGPLALLMHMIEKDQIDLYNIPITKITEQYLHYLETMEEFNIHIASEFLVMAATLLQIKSRLLLPRPPVVIVEEEDPRQELVDRLLEYRRFKQASMFLEGLSQSRRNYIARQPQEFALQLILPTGLKVDDLITAFAAVWESKAEEYSLVSRDEISVQDKMYAIIHKLHQHEGEIEFLQMIEFTRSRGEVVALFLALLELIRLKRVQVRQNAGFGPIYLMLREQWSDDVL